MLYILQVLEPNFSPLKVFGLSFLYLIRSSYFQQIEEDVQKYTKQILELRSTITNFKTKEMTELSKFHRDVESVLENLTDESQVGLENSCLYGFHFNSLHCCNWFFHLHHGKQILLLHRCYHGLKDSPQRSWKL